MLYSITTLKVSTFSNLAQYQIHLYTQSMIAGVKEQLTYFSESVIGLRECVRNLTQTVITYMAG